MKTAIKPETETEPEVTLHAYTITTSQPAINSAARNERRDGDKGLRNIVAHPQDNRSTLLYHFYRKRIHTKMSLRPLRGRTSAEAINEMLVLTEDPNLGPTGTGEAPLWAWILFGVLVGAILIICAVGCYRKEKKSRAAADDPSDAEKDGGTINDAVSEGGLDEPLL